MSTITKERIELFIKNPLENGLTRGEQMELARIALASLEAEAVAYMHHSGQVVTREECCDDKIFAICCKVETPLYAAPQLPQPAAVSVPAAMEMDDDFDSAFEHGKAVGWNAYRAAMLQAEPVSNSDELPLDYLQGHKDGLEWAAQLAEANHPQTGDWLYDDPIDLARAIRKGPDMPTVQGGNSPVTPDGWISCSEQMPEKYDFDIWVFSPSRGVLDGLQWDGSMFTDDEYQFVIHDATHWMRKAYPAAPQQDGE